MTKYSLKDLPGFLRDVATHDYLPAPDDYEPLLEESARIIEAKPFNMGHFDAIIGALQSATDTLTRGVRTQELNAAYGEAWSDIQRAIGYANILRRRVPEGDGFMGEENDTDSEGSC